MTPPAPIPDAHLFTHDAMNTTFSLRIRGMDESAARGIARVCCDRLDSLESCLSRFAEGSDVSRINSLGAGETLYLCEPTHQCLLLALNAYAETASLFDITLGSRIEHRKSGASEPAPPLVGQLTIHPDVPAITCESPGREIDLGGIGKGFALDQLHQLLTEWGVQDALLSAGGSSLLAFGPSAWPVNLTGDAQGERVMLTRQALSASGTGIQGHHIVHPGGAQAMPTEPCKRVWVIARTAAQAEIWSTALMLVSPDDMPRCIAGNSDIIALYTERDGGVQAVT